MSAPLGLLGAVASAGCYGVATVLQARGARAAATGADLRLVVRVVAQRVFLLGVALDGIGFLLSLAALRSLPLFVVEPVVAANLVVTAVLAPYALAVVLARREWWAIGLTCAGLAALGVVGTGDGAAHGDRALAIGLVGAALVLAVPAGFGLRSTNPGWSAGLGLVAGAQFAVLAVGVRAVPSLRPAALLSSPATYAVLVSGVLGFGCWTVALQRGRVVAAAAAMVAAETVLPAVAGVLLLGDRTRPGFAWLGALGFVVAVLGTIGLARFSAADALPGAAAGGGVSAARPSAGGAEPGPRSPRGG